MIFLHYSNGDIFTNIKKSFYYRIQYHLKGLIELAGFMFVLTLFLTYILLGRQIIGVCSDITVYHILTFQVANNYNNILFLIGSEVSFAIG